MLAKDYDPKLSQNSLYLRTPFRLYPCLWTFLITPLTQGKMASL